MKHMEEYPDEELIDMYRAGDEQAISLAALAEESYYSLTNSSVLTAEVSEQVKKNTIATGCCFAEVEVEGEDRTGIKLIVESRA